MENQPQSRYILDANVLLHDPESIYAYPDAHVIIPIFVIEEIDHFKKDFSETGRNARIVAKQLDVIREQGLLTKGVQLENGSILSVYVVEEREKKLPAFLNPDKSSNKVMIATLMINRSYPGNTYLVTNDINLRIRVSALNLKAMPYEDTRPGLEKFYEGIAVRDTTSDERNRLMKDSRLKIDKESYDANQSLILKVPESDAEPITVRYNSDQGCLFPIKEFTKGVWGVKARNREQAVALDLLMDPSVHIVMLAGKAGTGKTLLALAAALEQMLSDNMYEKILVSRPIFPMGKDMGYLPGDIDQKMEPWMQPIFDNLEFLSSNHESPKSKSGGYQRLMEVGLIELEPLTYIRGRSIPNRFMIVDEAQNLTPHELKTIVTRVGERTKLVLTGDPHQIDNPYMDVNSNGLSHVIEKFRSFQLAGHVNLMHGVRSKLAELASNIL
jgi:PhoH-like ATPase